MSLIISRILHAGYEFKSAHAQIWFDPIFENPFSRNCYAFPEIRFDLEQIKNIKPDAIFISHYHDDHCSFESLNLIDRKTPIYMYCVHDEMFSMFKELGFKHVFSLTLNQTIKIADLEITPWPALDRDVDCLFQVQHENLNILNVVDSWIDEETLNDLKNQKPWDLICWPFQTMREIEVLSPKRYKTENQSLPEEWLNQLTTLKPKVIIPSSCQFQMEPWSWYNEAFFPITYKQFNSEVLFVLPHSKVTRLNPGQSLELTKDYVQETKPLSWVTPIGDQNIDYKYNTHVIPPSTAEIAQHFTGLNNSEKKRVFDFCKAELLKRFKDLGPSIEPYFIKERFWKLSIFNELGKASDFFYQIKEENIKSISDKPDKVDWATEVPEQKLFAALELGESMTSMYLRIECSDEFVDLIEDPLIRCLFSEGFASYQKAQLKKLTT